MGAVGVVGARPEPTRWDEWPLVQDEEKVVMREERLAGAEFVLDGQHPRRDHRQQLNPAPSKTGLDDQPRVRGLGLAASSRRSASL